MASLINLSSPGIHLTYGELKDLQKNYSYISQHTSIGTWSALIIHATSIHICQLLEAIAPFVQVVIVLVLV